MTSSENNLDSNNGRPFVVHTVAQQPYPSFWYQNPAYNPFCVPGAGSRNGSLYFPCSVVPTQFWHYSGYARKMKTQETQTELQQEQHNGISQNSCESLGVPNNPQEDEVKDGVEIHNTLNSDLYPSSGDVTTCHERPLCISMEAVKDLSLQSRSQKTLVGERKPDNSRGSHGFPEKVDEEEVGEQNRYSQGAVPSAAWLAQFEKVDEAIQCDRSWWQDTELERCPESSTEDECNLEEEYEVEWLFEEDDSTSSKEKIYREACRATRLSHGPRYPDLVWPTINKNDNSKYAEYENIPLLCMMQRSEGHEILYSKLRTEHSAKQEGESQESLESEKSQG
ncbi:hypothetical protein mRhiFer1_008783 [Rhinolophus ferrumequinum]|uniref:Uncharacterized protein n=1 Tax=Rhinolophus ferrumequinum TaxID=59479 RepID=A0A7J7TN29_RHIFE|nr:hypothetical protein mRhiFer1_008783 [Rhinolophus ferrumequinum]